MASPIHFCKMNLVESCFVSSIQWFVALNFDDSCTARSIQWFVALNFDDSPFARSNCGEFHDIEDGFESFIMTKIILSPRFEGLVLRASSWRLLFFPRDLKDYVTRNSLAGQAAIMASQRRSPYGFTETVAILASHLSKSADSKEISNRRNLFLPGK